MYFFKAFSFIAALVLSAHVMAGSITVRTADYEIRSYGCEVDVSTFMESDRHMGNAMSTNCSGSNFWFGDEVDVSTPGSLETNVSLFNGKLRYNQCVLTGVFSQFDSYEFWCLDGLFPHNNRRQ
jgi:hypothetical protein